MTLTADDIRKASGTPLEPFPGVLSSPGGTSSLWSTGDYKVSAQAADHADPAGGSWLLCDGTAVASSLTALVALVGATRPDAQGRTLVMKGTHADVSTIGNSDGLAVANRRPKHKSSTAHTLTLPSHVHSETGFTQPATLAAVAGGGTDGFGGTSTGVPTTSPAINGAITVGPQTGAEPTDTPAYVVPGNLFIHT